jgi:hypothetical protein
MAKGHILILSNTWRVQPLQIIRTLSAIGLVVCTLVWLYLILLPAPLIIDTEQSSGKVYFSANRNVILGSGDCVLLRWQVDRIRNVYLNGQPQVGTGESETCISDEMPTLTVQFQDDSQHDYQLDITTLSTSPLTWVMVGFMLLAVIAHFTQVKSLVSYPKHLTLLFVLLTIIVIFFFAHLFPLSNTIASAQWLAASAATKDLLNGITLLIVLIILSVMIARDAFQPNDGSTQHAPRFLIGLWGIGFALTFGLIAATIVLINPLGMYFANQYPSYQLLLRGSKTEGYQHLPQTPDVVIMGSSRAFTLSPAYIEEQTGYSAYNMAIEGGRIEDILIQARQMQAFPKVMLIEIQDGLPRQPNDIAARAPLNWIPYMDFHTALLTVQKRLEGLVDINQLAEAIYTARYGVLYAHQPREWPLFEQNGFAVRPSISASELEQAILLDIGNIPPAQCETIDQTSQVEIDNLIQMAQERHTAIIFYMSPWHPQYIETLLRDNPLYQTCHMQSVQYMKALDQSSDQVFFLDYSRLESIDGATDVSGYFDSQHLTEANSQRLIHYALPTLQLAYQSTLQN